MPHGFCWVKVARFADGEEVALHPWWAILWKGVGLLRWALRGGIALWVVLLVLELTSPHPNTDRIVGILIVGGTVLYLSHRGIKALHRALTRSGRKAAREAFLRDPALSQRGSREEILILLLTRDWERIRLFAWSHRLRDLADLLLKEIFSGQEPKSLCQRGMTRCLALLEVGRGNWGSAISWTQGENRPTGGLASLEDEEALQFLLALLILLSGLFRLHLFRWGMPLPPFSRRAMARLRGTWLPFCLMEPTPRSFPPALPREMAQAWEERFPKQEDRTSSDFVSWIFRGDPAVLPRLVESLLT
jgi:hypothetical protein